MRVLTRRTLLSLTSTALCILASCGYTTGLHAPEGYETVGVAIFGNESKVPDLERDMHHYVSVSLRDTVKAPITTPDKADLVIRGRILDYSRFAGTRGPTNELLETGITINVEAWLEDGRTGELVGSKVYGAQTVGYMTIETSGEEDSKDRSLSYIAEGLILDLFARHSRPLHAPDLEHRH